MSDYSAQQMAERAGISKWTLTARLEALGLTAQDRMALRAFVPLVEAEAGEFLDGLYAQMSTVPELGGMLGGAEQVGRLKAMQRDYLRELFGAELDWDYVLRRVRIGAMHHRVGLTPQWFLVTYAHFVGGYVRLLFDRAVTVEDGLAQVVTLLKTALFDATVVLDSYGMAEEVSIRERIAASGEGTPRQAEAGEAGLAGGSEAGLIARVRVTPGSAGERREYAGLTAERVGRLGPLREAWERALPGVLDGFYAFFTAREETARLVREEDVERLREQVGTYWREFASGEFDRLYAASRMRVGVVHERIGLTPQWYLVGVAQQAEGLLAAAVQADRPGAAATVEAFVRGLFFDLSYVLDAYMAARGETILRTEGYASQLVAGLASGVMVIDGERRVMSVNRALVELLRTESAMLYRLPVEQVLELPELRPLLERAETERRATATGRVRGRQCRLRAVLLDGWEGVRGRPVAIVVDDIAGWARLAEESEQTEARLGALIQSADLTVWEMDAAATTVELISAPVEALTGYRDIYFLGRAGAWLRCIPEGDRERFEAYVRTLPAGGRGTVEYRMVRADGREIWVRTALRREERMLFGVTVDVTNERLTEQRRVERDLALERERAKSDLLATMSHEIRTPLNGVIGMLDYLLGSPLGAEHAGYVRTAQESALELLELLNDILDLSKLEVGRMELHAKRFDLAALLEGLLDLFGTQAKARGVDLRLMVQPGLAGAWMGDAARVRQILVNLCSNAVKFTKEGEVVIRVTGLAAGLEITVEDTGAGVPPEKRGRLFEPFTQAHVSMGGTGLGLSISRRLAELMGGTLRYEPRPAGGSRFVLELPLGMGEEEPLPAGEGRRLAVFLRDAEELRGRLEGAGWVVTTEPELDVCAYFIEDAALIPELPGDLPLVVCGPLRPVVDRQMRRAATHTLGLVPLNGKTLVEILSSLLPAAGAAKFGGSVLVAEDNPVSQRVVTLMLERLGFEVEVVMNGAFAVDAAERKAYALVVMDMLMPEMGGVEASRRIRAGGLNRGTPIIALTANAYAADRELCLEAGMDAVLTKPIQMEELASAVARYAARRVC